MLAYLERVEQRDVGGCNPQVTSTWQTGYRKPSLQSQLAFWEPLSHLVGSHIPPSVYHLTLTSDALIWNLARYSDN